MFKSLTIMNAKRILIDEDGSDDAENEMDETKSGKKKSDNDIDENLHENEH